MANITKQCVLFRVAKQVCAISIDEVKEILRNTKTDLLPEQPKFIEGILDLRGKHIPIIDLRRRFLFPIGKEHIDRRLIAVYIDQAIVGLKVDSVISIEKLELDSNLNKYFKKIYIKHHFINYVSSYKNELVTYINVNELFSEIERELLETVN